MRCAGSERSSAKILNFGSASTPGRRSPASSASTDSIDYVWGDTVNTASRLESSGVPNRIQISQATHHRIADKFHCELRGPINVKGKGAMLTYFLGERRTP